MKKYKSTYTTIKKIYGEINKAGINAYMVGGISVAVQLDIDLYRQNSDIDLMVEKKDLEKLIQILKKVGYKVEDKTGILTQNYIDENGTFHAMCHDLDAHTKAIHMLGIGIFVYERNEETIIKTSYVYDEREKYVIGFQQVMPKELFDLIYDNTEISYKGTMVKCQSKEYTYLSKSLGTREKDKIDASIIEKHIGPQEQKRVDRIKILQKRIQEYKIKYGKDGNIISSEKQPGIEEKIESFISQIAQANKGLLDEELKQIILNNETVKAYMEQDEDINVIMNLWKESLIEGNIAETAKNIAHKYYYSDEPYVISTNSLGKISVNTPVSEIDRQRQLAESKVYERTHRKEGYDKNTSYPNSEEDILR